MVIAGAVVQVDVPAVVAAPAVVAQDGRSSRRPSSGRSGFGLTHVVIVVDSLRPQIAVAAPGVERAVVAGFLDGVEDVAELDDVAAPATVADVDAGTRHVVDASNGDGDDPADMAICDSRRLFFNAPDARIRQSSTRQSAG